MRRAFTLIEIITTMLIMSILTAIVWAVYNGSLDNARSEATRATISQLKDAVRDRREGFGRDSSHAAIFKQAYDHPLSANTPATIPIGLAEILVAKENYRAAFPQRVEDLWGFDGVPDTIDDAPLWSVWKTETGANASTPRPASHTIGTESSELLLLSLRSTFGNAVQGLDSIATTDEDGDGVNEVRDQWGNPIRFYNWPTRIVRPGGEFADIQVDRSLNETARLIPAAPEASESPNNPGILLAWELRHPLNIDPDDPTGRISIFRDGEDINQNGLIDSEDWNEDGSITADEYEDADADGTLSPGSHPNIATGFNLTYQTSTGPVTITARPFTEDWYHTLNTYHVPLIVSAGPDEVLGIVEPSSMGPERNAQPIDTDAIQDNVVSR